MLHRGMILLGLLVVLGSGQTPPKWGGNPRYTVKVSMLNNDPQMRWDFNYYYDMTQKVERYEHQGPQADEMCLLAKPPFTINDSCVVIFASDGWSYIQYPKWNWCCKCENSFGYINYDWLKDNSTYVGSEVLNGVTVTHWTKTGAYLNHYYSTVDKALPVKFFQIKKGNPKSWDFYLNTYSTAPIDPAKFTPPCKNLCGGECPLFRKL